MLIIFIYIAYLDRCILISRTESVALIFAARVSKVIKKVFTFSFSETLSLSVEWKEMEGSITIKTSLSRIYGHLYIRHD